MESTKITRLLYVGFALLMSILLEILVWGNSPGLGFVLFVGLYLPLFLGLAAYTKHIKNKSAFLLLIPIAVLCFNILSLNNSLVQYFGPLLTMILLILFSVLVTIQNPSMHGFALSKIPLFRNAFTIFGKFGHIASDVLSPFVAYKRSKVLANVLIGVLVAIPVLLLFLFLFMGADAIFAEWIGNIFDPEFDSAWFPKFIRAAVLWMFLSSFLYILISDKHELMDKAASAIKIDNITSAIVLGSVNVLFLIFVFFQLRYLFGDADYLLEQGTTFAEYARSGFFELSWVIAFAGVLIGIVYWSMSHHKNSRIVNILQVLLGLQVGVVAISALERMNLYQEAYGYTVLRLRVEWFIYFVLVLLAFSIVAIVAQFRFKRFFHSVLVMGLTALVLVFSVNVDYMIAKQNVDHYLESESEDATLDIRYLDQLSVDVLPVFLEYDKRDFGKYDYDVQLVGMYGKYYSRLIKGEMTVFEYNLGKSKAFELREELEAIYGSLCMDYRGDSVLCN